MMSTRGGGSHDVFCLQGGGGSHDVYCLQGEGIVTSVAYVEGFDCLYGCSENQSTILSLSLFVIKSICR